MAGHETHGVLCAGINAARRAQQLPTIVIPRDSSYLGTLVDDLVTKASTSQPPLLIVDGDCGLSTASPFVGAVVQEQLHRGVSHHCRVCLRLIVSVLRAACTFRKNECVSAKDSEIDKSSSLRWC